MKRYSIIFILIISGVLGFITSLYMHSQVITIHKGPLEKELDDRLTKMLLTKDSAKVSTQSTPLVRETYHSPATFVKKLKNDPDAGQKIFKEFCSVCHGLENTIDVKAPKIGDKQVWRGFNHLGIDELLRITIKGSGAMPARGGCFECSDEQLRAAIVYILKNSST